MTPGEAREHTGLTIAAMVRLMRVPRSTWNSWERGENSPDAAAARLIELVVWLYDNEPAVFARLAKI